MVISKMNLSELETASDACVYVIDELEKLQIRIYENKETKNADIELRDVLSKIVFDCKKRVVDYNQFIMENMNKRELENINKLES